MLNREITDYTITGSNHSGTLCDNINTLIKHGWQPYGNPFVILDEMVQPMVKLKALYEQPTQCKALGLGLYGESN